MTSARRATEQRFWSRVDKRNPDDCWQWTGSKNGRGYGYLRADGKTTKAHRFSFVLAFGWEPPSVLHKCDNPPCVNPRHLFGGTQADNMADCAAKWRSPRAKVTPAVKSTIFALHEIGLKQVQVAHQVGLSEATISRTLRGVCNPGPFEGEGRCECKKCGTKWTKPKGGKK